MFIRKVFFIPLLLLLINSCSVISELTALKTCEFRLYSFQDPSVCGIDLSNRRSLSDFTFLDGQMIAANLLRGTLPFAITVNMEVKNPGTNTAAVNSIEWIAYVDDLEVASGVVDRRVEIAPSGGLAIVPVKIEADLIDYMEGNNPNTILNFAMNLVGTSDQPSNLSMKIKPSLLVGKKKVHYPGFFTVTHEFSSGEQTAL